MVFGESATYEGCPLARVIHWKNRRPQYRGSYRLTKSQLAYKSISQPHLLYFTSVVASQVVRFVSLWQDHLGNWHVFTCGHMRIMWKGRCLAGNE